MDGWSNVFYINYPDNYTRPHTPTHSHKHTGDLNFAAVRRIDTPVCGSH